MARRFHDKTSVDPLWAAGPYSFGFNFDFGFLEIGEPWSSVFALACAASFIWAGCSLLRKRSGVRPGAITGMICFLIFAIGAIRAW
jgi:hypothetical protein